MTADDMTFGWDVTAAPDSVKLVAQWLENGKGLTGAVAIIADCQTDLLEFVYVEQRDERLLVSDRGETAKYLELGDHTHRPLDATTIRAICEKSGVALVDVEDMWPHVTVDTSTVSSVAHAVQAVAQAMDHVFETALTIRT